MSSTTKLTVGELIEVYDGLFKLDGYMKDGKANPFDFDEQTKWNIPKAMRILKEDYTKHTEDRDLKIKELSPVYMNLQREDPAKYETFRLWHKGQKKLSAGEYPGINKLKRSNLMKAGPIPGSVIMDLMPIIEDDGETPAKPEDKKP
jgi:hypothetical protein